MSDEDIKDDAAPESEDDIVEFEFNEDGEEDLKKTLKKLRADLKQAKKEKEEYLTGWQKERADFANYKKDEENRRRASAGMVEEGMLSRFLSVQDSFNMAMADRAVWEKVDPNWRRGVEHIYTQLRNVFEEFGVMEVGQVGEAFDPYIHHSIDTVATDKKELDHTVAQVIQKGYKLEDRILRPAQVKVYEYKNSE